MNKLTSSILVALALVAASCGGNGVETRPFPKAQVPSIITSDEDARSYMARHYWDRFFATADDWKSDTAVFCGVTALDFETAYGKYVVLLNSLPLEIAITAQDTLINRAEALRAVDPSSVLYRKVCDLSEHYLFDPNSPVRCEDLYVPILKKMVSSPFTPEGDKVRAEHYIPLCSLNRIGTKAADFTYTLKNGRTGNLYDVKADHTLMFFSNPGCENCKQIIETLSGYNTISEAIAKGRLAVLNVYPDEDLDEWYKYMSHYPDIWINGYDAEGVLNSNTIYNLRAIPSLYLLDEDKNVILKDAPLDVVLKHLWDVLPD